MYNLEMPVGSLGAHRLGPVSFIYTFRGLVLCILRFRYKLYVLAVPFCRVWLTFPLPLTSGPPPPVWGGGKCHAPGYHQGALLAQGPSLLNPDRRWPRGSH